MRNNKGIDMVRPIKPNKRKESTPTSNVTNLTGCESIIADDFNDVLFNMVTNGNCLAHLDTDGVGDSMNDIVGRGEAINNISIIFHNKGIELFRNLIYTINNVYTTKLQQECPLLYKKIIEADNNYRGHDYRILNDLEFINTFRFNNNFRNELLPTYTIDADKCMSVVTFSSTITKLCTLEMYINMNLEDIHLIGLSAASLAYEEVINRYYIEYYNTGLMNDYKRIAGEVSVLLLNGIESIINILFADARQFYNNNIGAIEAGPFISYEQMASMYTNKRNERLSVFVKEN